MLFRSLSALFLYLFSVNSAFAAKCIDVFPAAYNQAISSSEQLTNFPANNSADFINDGTILSRGDNYYLGSSLGDNDEISLAAITGSNTTARLYFRGSVTWQNVKINQNGNPEDLIIVVDSGLSITGDQTLINAIIYVKGALTISGATINGALTSVGSGSGTAIYNASDITNADFNGMCDSSSPAIPIVDYHFDECTYTGSGTEITDQTGIYNASINGVGESADDAQIIKSLDLSATGTSDWVALPSGVIDGLNDLTLSVWVNVDNGYSQQEIFHALGSSTGDDELEVYLSNDTDVHVKVQDAGTTLQGNITITDGTWHHILLTRANDQVCLYVDSQFQDCRTGVGSGQLSVPDFDGIVLGQEQDSYGGSFNSGQSFKGLIDEFKIFDQVLSTTELTSLYDNEYNGKNHDGTSRDAVICDVEPIVEYRFEESGYSGVVDEVIDETGNFNAITVDGVITDGASPALTGNPGTCRYASFNDNYVALPDSFENLQGSFTITAWINPSDIDKGSRIFADDELNQTGYAFSLGDPGNGKLRFYSRGVSPVSVDTTTSIPINTWTFVTAVHNSDNKTRQIYINGQPQIVTGGETSNTYTGSWGTDAGVASIGGETDAGESNRRFTGSIDEVRVYESALSQSEIASVYNETHACTEPAINHYQIIHDGNGLTCDAETVTIKACTNTYDGSCTLSTDAVTLDVIAIGGPTVTNSLTFTGTDEVDLSYTTAESVALSLDNISISPSNTTVCNDNSSGSCNISFANAGFRFLSGTSGTSEVIANQISGTNFPLRLQAVENSGGVCTGLFTGNIDVKLAQENLDPIGTTGLKFNVNGSDIDKYPNISTKASLNFGSDSIATIPSAYYKDAGQIRLQASYINSGVTLVGSSQNFWVSPNKLVITAQSSGSNIDGATASSTTVHKAGENFDLVVTAYNSLGTGDENITKNYQQGQLQLKLTRVKPTITGSVDGGLNYASGSTITSGISPVFADHALTSFSDGKSTFSNAQFAEVGIINLAVQDINYGSQGLSIAATDITIGRFTPNHFEQTVQAGGSFLSTCNRGSTTFTYSGQKDDATQTQGTISYLSNPVLKIIAKNAAGATVENYYQDSEGTVDDFMKLTASEINITEPTIDSSNVGIDLSSLPVSSAMSRGILSQTVTRGELEYKFSDSDRFYYQRSSNTLVTPFISNIDFTVASIISVIDDDISATTTNNVTSTVGIDIRFGRLVLENTFGPETSNLPLVLKAEYFDGSNFVLNTDDHCTAFNPNKVSLTNLGLDPALSAVIGANGIFVDGFANDISLQATGTNNLGDIGIDYDTFEWLKFKWNNTDENSDLNFYDDNPSAVATFGVYRGNDRIISWREVGN